MIVFFTSLAVLLGGLIGAYYLWAQRIEREIIEGAALEWAHLSQTDPDILTGYDQDSFTKIYRKVHFPRFPGYALSAFVSFIVSLPLIFMALSLSVWLGEKLGIAPGAQDLAKYVPLTERSASEQTNEELALYLAQNFSGFYFFFGVIFVWLLIFAFFMRRYHQQRPGYLRDELIRNRA